MKHMNDLSIEMKRRSCLVERVTFANNQQRGSRIAENADESKIGSSGKTLNITWPKKTNFDTPKDENLGRKNANLPFRGYSIALNNPKRKRFSCQLRKNRNSLHAISTQSQQTQNQVPSEEIKRKANQKQTRFCKKDPDRQDEVQTQMMHERINQKFDLSTYPDQQTIATSSIRSTKTKNHTRSCKPQEGRD